MFKTQGSPATTNDEVCKYAIQWGYGGPIAPDIISTSLKVW